MTILELILELESIAKRRGNIEVYTTTTDGSELVESVEFVKADDDVEVDKDHVLIY